MSNRINKMAKFILSWEGSKYTNDPNDSGGPTKYGVTLATWKKLGYDKNGDGKIDEKDVQLITTVDATSVVLKKSFWDKWKADDINCEWIAYLLVDWLWTSGVYGVKYAQQILGVTADGIIGPKTIAAINSGDPKTLFTKLWRRRYQHLFNLSKPGNKDAKYRNGWLRRQNSITYGALKDSKGNTIK